ncbi:MAG: plasmid maintenance system killer, partial [Deltaproteobacteria bacterium HGW-Deltaproteobacteria-10]
MIKTFADKHTHDLFVTGKSKKFQPDILKRAVRRLEYIDLAM